MAIDAIDLERFSLGGLLGLGANYEVYAAIDRETGKDVVLKRPCGADIRGGQSRHVDELSARLIEVHQLLGSAAPYISPLVGYTEWVRHDRFFGDALPQEYYVVVEERARGVPLVADIKDKFRGVPIGLGQNLFALYPLVQGSFDGPATVFEQLLDVEEAFTRVDCLIMDLRPQMSFSIPNAVGSPSSTSAVVDVRTASGSRAAPDIHDFG